MKRILIIGGGFGGVQSAIVLSKKLKKENYTISVIAKRNVLFLFPFSIWIPVGLRTVEQLSISMSELAQKHGFEYREEDVVSISSKDKKVKTEKNTYQYDYLIIASGTQAIPIEGLENTHELCSKPKNLEVAHQKLQKLVEKGSGTIVGTFGINTLEDSINRSGPLLEVLFNIDSFLRTNNLRDAFRLIFIVENWNHVERALGRKALDEVKKLLLRRNVEVITDKTIASIGNKNIIFDDGTGVESDLTFYAPGLRPNTLLENSDLSVNKAGFITVDSSCRVIGNDDCYAIGDCASYGATEWGLKQGRVAEIMGTTAAKAIIAAENNGKSPSFNTLLDMVFMLDMGRDGIVIIRGNGKNIVRSGTLGHLGKLALEKVIRFSYLKSFK